MLQSPDSLLLSPRSDAAESYVSEMTEDTASVRTEPPGDDEVCDFVMCERVDCVIQVDRLCSVLVAVPILSALYC